MVNLHKNEGESSTSISWQNILTNVVFVSIILIYVEMRMSLTNGKGDVAGNCDAKWL